VGADAGAGADVGVMKYEHLSQYPENTSYRYFRDKYNLK
jgi:hypothetical protein